MLIDMLVGAGLLKHLQAGADLAAFRQRGHVLHAEEDFAHAGLIIFPGEVKGTVLTLGHAEHFAQGHVGVLLQRRQALRAEELELDPHGDLFQLQPVQYAVVGMQKTVFTHTQIRLFPLYFSPAGARPAECRFPGG